MCLQEPTSGNDSSNIIDQKPAEQVATVRTFGLGLGLTILIGTIAMLLAPLPVFSIIGSFTVALLLGLVWRSVIGLPTTHVAGVKFSAQKLLRYGIILTGIRLNFTLIISSGVKVLILDTLVVLFGLLAIPWLAHKLGLSKRLAFLLGVGQSICGASAIGVIGALLPYGEEEDISLAIAICGLVGTVGVLLFTFGSHLLPLPRGFYGLLVGSTLHEIAQVVAAGTANGTTVADLAMVVKLTRVLLLAPTSLIVTLILSVRREYPTEYMEHRRFDWNKVPLPWFVFGFLAVGAGNSLGLLPQSIASFILQASISLMVVAMAAMGLMVDLSVIRKTGLKALGVAMFLFIVFAAVSSLLIAILSQM
jgi:uncharacterized integral membrane protein (TIGR00698 family)